VKSIAEVLSLSTAFLTEKKLDRSRRSAEELLASVLGVKRIDLYLQHDRPLVESELDKMRALLKRRATGEPLEQILGEVEFYHCHLAITSDVLIPRQETEILVDLIAKRIKESSVSGRTLWDLCTGSGCIGLSLKKAFSELNVSLSDICPKALALAKKNAEVNHLEVDFRMGDLLEPFFGESADFIICNPPYVSQKEYDALDPGVRDFEPRSALLAGDSGTEFYERIARDLPPFLRPGAQIFFEIGSGQGSAVQEIFSSLPWRRNRLLKDWAGKDRFFFLEIE
jgi:release factor glutamine methyltransferase